MQHLIDEVNTYGRPAISGQGGNNAAFAMACKLWRKSSDEQAIEQAFMYYNSTKCTPKFDDERLKRILKSAKNATEKENEVGKYAQEMRAIRAIPPHNQRTTRPTNRPKSEPYKHQIRHG